MSTAIATANGPPNTIDPAILEKVVVNGDLSKLTSDQRLSWYRARCDAAGLDPRTQPFQYLSLQGKLTLYATKAATDQLIALHKLTTQIIDRRHLSDIGVYEVQVRVTFPDGHFVEDVAALSIAGLKADVLCNAIMKCVTKGKRRTVLSACGLGMLDESEVETIPGAFVEPAPEAPVRPQNESGHKTGQYASPEQVAAYLDALRPFVEAKNQAWLDHWTDGGGELPASVKRDPLNLWQADNHLLKWCVQTGRLDEATPEQGKARQVGAYCAIVYHRDKASRRALTQEMARYADEQLTRADEAIRAKHPELFGGEVEDAGEREPGDDE